MIAGTAATALATATARTGRLAVAVLLVEASALIVGLLDGGYFNV